MKTPHDVAPEQKLREEVGPEGGPSCRFLDSEEEIRSFDATCRKLHRFLESLEKPGQSA